MPGNSQARSHTAGRAGAHRGRTDDPTHDPIKALLAHRAALSNPLLGAHAAHLQAFLQQFPPPQPNPVQTMEWKHALRFSPGLQVPFLWSPGRRTRIAANDYAGKSTAGTIAPPTASSAGGGTVPKPPARVAAEVTADPGSR